MKCMIFLLAATVLSPVMAQTGAPDEAAAQLQEAQRRAEIRRVLQERQSPLAGQAVPVATRRLSQQERAELREALRNQRPVSGESKNSP